MTHGKQKIIAFTPAGRRRYMDILEKHVALQNKIGVIDEWVLFNNAYTKDDENYLYELRGKYPWVSVVEQEGHRDAFHIHAFYKHLTDPNAVYIRLDDDIVYISPRAIKRLAESTVNVGGFLTYPVIIGNSRMTYWLQQDGVIPMEWGVAQNEILDHATYVNAEFVEKLHRLVLEHIANATEEYFFQIRSRNLPSVENPLYSSPESHISVNAFGMRGEDMVAIGDKIISDEERYLSMYRPAELGSSNFLDGTAAIVVHFAYHTLTEALEKTDLLDQYRLLADQLLPEKL